ncbi:MULTISPECIES: Gfo/Idh/MocA family oxidoreductase [unclassified Actinomyces]|uniref:Gfo/Idh/MocA family protein n=1 Tax=unclassified Actinomyces TaxID=2609248 RepID=UPI0020174FCC|nr:MULTISPECIES: Gfo/Idh/MocA family oxidoreductase [unclassified Actinomyces]MCL3777596.1 Gfo/Idh/MocA family oxidoreductase [Actinomyces sp. AC-20-1]MCL3790499.1 Gfo/Idh/MocA family oxidoreductase [Actinomyces sp. 187325]MCL3791204.1 Gfo/Idh/MocA family oxidoreductase [Actinomyces sp. 186855]MCL3794471.1 Gfo/Idh/MocA family oxidoreductase [Actinomyces sp. 217892]
MSTTPAPLAVAVIGAGMAGTTHANAWRQVGTVFDLGLPKVRLAAITDAYEPFATDAAERYGYERAVTDWRDIADDPSIDIVSIVVGNALHREIAEAMIRAGKHVLCEKPLADTLENARAMAEAEAASPGVVTSTGFTYRRNAAVAEIKKLVETGHLGDVSHINARYWCDYGCDPSTPMAWRYSGPMGSGALGDVGSHLIDTAETICGPLVSVSGGALATLITQRPVAAGHVTRGTALDVADAEMAEVTNDDVAAFTGHFANGAIGSFSASRIAWNMPNAMMIDIHGSRGRAYWDLARTGEILVDDASAPAGLAGPRQVLVNPTFPYFERGSSMAFGGVGATQIEQFTYQAHAFLQQVAGVSEAEALPRCATFADGYREMRIAAAVAESAANGGATVDVSTF